MTLEEELAEVSVNQASAVTVGVFDGVHKGHLALVRRTVEIARAEGLESVVVTFRQHPKAVLSPEREVPFLTDLSQRRRLLMEAGVDHVVVLSFTPELAALSAGDFLKLLQRTLKIRALVIGHDFALGRGRAGDPASLIQLGEEMGFSVEAIGPVEAGGEVASSTGVRQALAAGSMGRVSCLLGRHFNLHGRVVGGAARGTWLGYPTANLEVAEGQALPPDGIYAVRAHAAGEVHPALAYLGFRPTFKETNHVVEVYLIDFSGDLYEQEMRVDMLAYLREDRKFDDIEELKAQIALDVETGRRVLAAEGVASDA
jgi:riboflavin kinase / FMN adenylyltransferase